MWWKTKAEGKALKKWVRIENVTSQASEFRQNVEMLFIYNKIEELDPSSNIHRDLVHLQQDGGVGLFLKHSILSQVVSKGSG